MGFSDVGEWLDHLVPRLMRESGAPGVSVAVVEDGETIYAQGFGARDLERNLPATPDTLYGIGSVTKGMVALATLKLVEEGAIGLDEPVGEALPLKIGLEDNPIRVRHLLTHSLGLPSLATSSIALQRGLGFPTHIPLSSPQDFYRFVNGAQGELVDAPGRRFFYHNAAWRMLGHLVQLRSGVAFHRYLEREVLRPLGMARSTLDTRRFQEDPDRITCYLRKPDGTQQPTPFPYPNPEDNPEFSFLSAAGGVISSANEMSRYLNLLIQQDKIVSKELHQEMQSLHIPLEDGLYGKKGYGFGVFVTPDFHGAKMVHHGGSILVSTAHVAVVPSRGLGVVALCNSSQMPLDLVAESCLALLMGLDPLWDTPGLAVRERLRRLAGKYQTYRGVERVEVAQKGGMLFLERETPLTRLSQPLIPVGPLVEEPVFYTWVNGVRTPVVFRVGEGKVDMLWERYCFHKPLNT